MLFVRREANCEFLCHPLGLKLYPHARTPLAHLLQSIIDWVKGSIDFGMKVASASLPIPVLMLTPSPEPEPVKPKLSPADRSKLGKPLRVTLINAKAFSHESMMQGSQCFRLQVATPEATGRSATTILGPTKLDGVPKEYHNFADVFSKYKAGVLADHCPYDLKITLKEGADPPFGPIYSLSQEELLARCKFIDENTATGFIRPSCSPCPYSSYGRRTAPYTSVAISGESTGS